MSTAVIVIFVLFLAAVAVRLARSIPTARAWDPNTHDKMTVNALDLLEKAEPKTFAGWFIRHQREHYGGALEFFEHQLRRASIEEDMFSHLVNALEMMSGVLGAGVTTLGVIFPAAGRILMLAKWAAGYGISKAEALEGANGGYHFYNPVTGKGLGEPVWVSTLLTKLPGTDCTDPMPSALERAFIQDANTWKLDHEQRTYVYVDANNYYRRGYPHLASYALGRYLHLLQDMAVPSHVRDDSHFGIPYVELGDPLEKRASGRDWQRSSTGFGTPLPQPEATQEQTYMPARPPTAQAPPSVLWGFDPGRGYSVDQDSVFNQAHESWQAFWTAHRGNPPMAMFKELAGWTHGRFFSLGTIPGNGDAHDPNDSRKWYSRAKAGLSASEFWERCEPNPRAGREAIRRQLATAQEAYKAWPDWIDHDPKDLSDGLGRLSKALTSIHAELTPAAIVECVNALDAVSPFLQQSLLAHPVAIPSGGDILDPLEPGSRSTSLRQMRLNREQEWIRKMKDFVEPREKTREALAQLQALAATFSGALEELLKQWIDTAPEEPMKALFEGLNGPCFLGPGTIDSQYVETSREATLFTAASVAGWFEALFGHKEGALRGLPVWRTKNTEFLSDVPEPTVLQLLENNDVAKADEIATIGIANHLPGPVTLEVEVELVEDEEVSDPNILDEGLNLRLNWGWSGPPLPGAAAPAAPGMKWEPQIMQRVILSRKEGLKNKFLLLNVPPHALAAMKKLAIGGEERRIDGNKGGGILRQEEGDLIPSLRRVPGQGHGLDDIHAAYLRFDARAVDEGKPLYVPEEIPPPSLEQSGPLPSP